MTLDTFRFGIVGCGAIAPFHAKAISALENATLRGVYSHTPQSAHSFAQQYGGCVYDSFEAMLSDPLIDVVCICTPSVYHGQQAIAALRSGKHVVLEKPMALSVEEADAVLEACKESGKLLTVVFQSCFHEDVERLRRLVAEHAFGKITHVHLTMAYWRDSSYFSSSVWKGKLAYEGGGALMNQGIHGINLLQYILGMPQVLCAEVKTMVHAVEVEDSVTALVRFKNGAAGTIQASTCAWPGFPRRLEIYGDQGFAVLREEQLEQLLTPNACLDLRGKLATQDEAYRKPNVFGFELHMRQIANLLDAITGKAPLVMDAAGGKRSIQIISDIYAMGGRK